MIEHSFPPKIGTYRLIRRVAIGGMGEIFYALNEGPHGFSREVALKRLHPEQADNPQFVAMFLNEGRITSLLNHPNIVQVFDFKEEEKTLYIAMEWVDGADLQEILRVGQERDEPLSISHAVELTRQALRGLMYAHEFTLHQQPMHIIHRDISPHNLLLSRQGVLKLTDFGIARMVDHLSLTSTGVLKGKIAYMAPEQTRSSRVTQQADIFSMGILLWEMLCQRRLFADTSEMRSLELVREAPIVWPHHLRPEIPIALSELVMWSLQRNLEERIPNARTFLRYLDALAPLLPTTEPLQDYLQRLLSPSSKAHAQTQELSNWQPPTPPFASGDKTLADKT